ncbi:MAG: CcmD family protein [Bacteroidota bacterium]
MMHLLKKTGLFFFLLITNTQLMAQQVPAQSFMRSSGRIYVVVAVMLTILFGLLFYIIRIDRKLTRLEKDN